MLDRVNYMAKDALAIDIMQLIIVLKFTFIYKSARYRPKQSL